MARLGDQGSQFTLYTSLLQATLEEDLEDREVTLAAGIATLLRRRAEMMALGAETRAANAPARAVATMSYDAALVRLCQSLDIGHLFFAGTSPDRARAEAEAALSRRLPALSEDLLGDVEPTVHRSPTAARGPEPGARP